MAAPTGTRNANTRIVETADAIAANARASESQVRAQPDDMDGALRVHVSDSGAYRRVLGHYPTGVCVVTACDQDGRAFGMVVGSFTSVSLDPPLVAFFADKLSTSWRHIERSGHFCVNVLGGDQRELCDRFSRRGAKKFAGLPYALSGNGSPVLEDVIAWIDCGIHSVHEAGDHDYVLGLVKELKIVRARTPMLFFRGQFGEFAPGG